MKKLFTLFLTLIAGMMAVQAATGYSCDFETLEQRDRWVLNPAANQTIDNKLENRWYIGAPGNYAWNGYNGLYISDDQGQTAQYHHTASCWNFAYDTVALDPLASGDYTISFDYCAGGNMVSHYDGLYLLWIPMTKPNGDSIKVFSNNNASIPNLYKNYIIRLQPLANQDYLNGTSCWSQCVATIPNSLCDGTPHYLAFVWANGSNLAQQPGAMVDNILISNEPSCDQPTNLTASYYGSTLYELTWTGSTAVYEVSAYSYETGTWSLPSLVNGNFTTFASLPAGLTDFVVRAKCDDNSYSQKSIVSKLVYYPDQLCIDYLNLDNAVCYINNSDPVNTLTFNDFRVVAPIEHGPSSINSRHTVHFDPNELEPRTGNMAHTVPQGELASIRLGNWDNGNQAERIEYSFEVDTIKFPILLLKYMPILEAPGHEDEYNPRFKLDILINGQSIGECGKADFNCNDVLVNGQLKPEAAAQGWHVTPGNVAFPEGGREDVVWKEWTTVGINLRNSYYHGQTLTIQLTTHDCAYSAHCGYAYFTLGCSDGAFKGLRSDQFNPTLEAPDGFNYRWAYAYNEKYRRADGSLPEQYILGRSQIFDAGMMNDSVYVVDCMFKYDSTCYFSLYTTTQPTEPTEPEPCTTLSGTCGNNLTWELTCDSVLTISGTGAMWRLTEEQAWRPYKDQIKTAILPEGLDSIAPKAFYQCTNLTSVNLPNSVRAIGTKAFFECYKLTEPVYNERIFAFMPKNFIGAYTVPEGIVSVAAYAFYGCWDMTELTFPSSLKRLGSNSVVACNLTKITSHAIEPPTCNADVFKYYFEEIGVLVSVDTSIPVYVPAGSVEAYKAADQWKDFLNILPIEETVETIEADYNVVYTGHDNNELSSEFITLHVPVAPEIEGFTFLKWQVVAGDLENGIVIEAVYTADSSISAPAVYTDPANPAQKLIREGNVYILKGDKTYSITGQEVK